MTAMSQNFTETKDCMGEGFGRLTSALQQEQGTDDEEYYSPDNNEEDAEADLPRLNRRRPDHDISASDSDPDEGIRPSLKDMQKLATVKVGNSLATNSGSSKVASLLSSLKKQVDTAEETSDSIGRNLADIIDAMCKNGLSETEQKDKTEKYLRPQNCEMLGVTKVNQLIWDKLTSGTRSADVKLQNIQKLLVKGVIPLVKVADTLLQVITGEKTMPPEQELFEQLTDSIGLLTSANYSLNIRRRELITPDMNTDYQGLKSAKNVPLTTRLFGDDLEKTVEDITEANCVGKKVNKNTNTPTALGVIHVEATTPKVATDPPPPTQ